MAGSTLPEKVAQIYYTYGLVCSSYPIAAVTLALSVVLLCCYPLLNVPLPGNIPTVVNIPWRVDNAQHTSADCSNNNCFQDIPLQLNILLNESQIRPYIWAKDKPFLYVQQIVMKIGVSPWNNNLKMWDAFRAPLQEVFRLLEKIRNHEDPETKSTLVQHCYQIEGVKRRDSEASGESVLPEYSCLLLSPANLWQQNPQSFSLDANIVNTVYKYQKGKRLSEMAFGMQLRDTGIKRYPFRARPRVLQYAVTIFYQNPEQRFIQSLNNKLKEMYPLFQETYTPINEVTLIYYPGQFNYIALILLLITFVVVLLFVYFFVRKIEFIKSKFGLAACAGLTIAGSLSMSTGICFYFGFSLRISLSFHGLLTYAMLIMMALENMIVLIKSVTSTDSRLDVKIRLAQGLSKEGWSITSTLLSEITVVTLSFFTFVPFIQEFVIFVILSIISDFFILMVFFATILSIGVDRMECFQDQDNKLHLRDYFSTYSELNWHRSRREDKNVTPQRMKKSKSHPRLNGLAPNSPTDVVANVNGSPGHQDHRVPKRIRFVNIWTRTRFFHRSFMLMMLVWVSTSVYHSGIVDYFIPSTEKSDREVHVKNYQKTQTENTLYDIFYNNSESLAFSPLPSIGTEETHVDANDTMLKHSPHSRPWSRLSANHWSGILSQYNESLAGRYAVVLPPLLLSHRVAPELAAALRHPAEREPPPLHWQALAAALDPIDIIADFELKETKSQHQWGKASELPIYPTTPMEILLLAILCAISVAVIAYMMVVLYRCICSRHYAEWRASWNEDEYNMNHAKQPAEQLVKEAVPVVVAGHAQEVECLATDGEKVVSSCLQGNIKVWDAESAELVTNIDRSAFIKLQNDLYGKTQLKRNERSALNEPFAFDPSALQPVRAASLSLTTVENTKELYSEGADDKSSLNESKENLDTSNIDNQRSQPDQTERTINNSESNCGNDLLYSVNNSTVTLRNRYRNNLVNNSGAISGRTSSERSVNPDWKQRPLTESPIWCLDFSNDLIVLGCADGRIEFWEARSGKLMCIWWMSPRGGASGEGGVTHVRVLPGARHVAAASLAGHLTLLAIEAYNAASGAHVDWQFSTAYRRTHKRTGSAGALYTQHGEEGARSMSFSNDSQRADLEEIVCNEIAQCVAHQQPITEMQSGCDRILTGGQDHILKVFSSTKLKPLLKLHGHCGPVTSCFIDHSTPPDATQIVAGSGSQDGLLCVWDLKNGGACLYSTQAHDGALTSLAYTTSYVVSAGTDERLCIWDRFHGHMLNSIHIGLNYMSRMLPLTHTILLMGDRGGLAAYDLSGGEVMRRVMLGQNDGCIFVRQILPLKDAIVCDYANQLRIVRFPKPTFMNSKCD